MSDTKNLIAIASYSSSTTIDIFRVPIKARNVVISIQKLSD